MIRLVVRKVQMNNRAVKRRNESFLLRWITKKARFIRVAIRSQIRRRKRNSKPGQSPSNRLGFLKKGILYAVDRDALIAVIGAKKTRSNIAGDLERGTGDIDAPRPFVAPGFVKGLQKFNDKQQAGKI